MFEIKSVLYESDEQIADVATSDEEDCVFSDIDPKCDSWNGESVPSDIESIEDEIDSMQITYIGKPHTKRFPLTRFPKCVHFLTTLLLQRD